MKRIVGAIVASVLCGGLMVLPSTSPPADAATSWPITADVSPASIEVVGDNKLSLLDCGQSYSEQGPGTPAQSFYLDGVRKPSSTYTGGTYAFLPWGQCSSNTTVSTADGTFYTGVHRGEWGPSGVVKEKNSRIMWTADIKVCPSKQYKYGRVTAMEMGANNRLYMTLQSEADYSDCADRFVIIDAISGRVIADKPLTATRGYIAPRVWVYANKAVVLDHEGYAYHFDLNGNQIGGVSNFLVGKNAFNVWADSAQNVYSYTMGDNYCRSPLKLRKFSSARQVTVAYTFPSTVTCDMGSMPLPGGSVGVLEQSQSSLRLTRYTPGGTNVSIDGVVPTGYSEEPVRTDADTAGNVLYVARRSGYIGDGKYEKSVVIRLFNFSTKTVKEVWNSQSALPNGKDIEAWGGNDIYGNHLYINLCNHVCGPVTQASAKIYKIALPGFGTKYQTSGSFVPITMSQKLNYVAMGDSFSTGEGNPPFIYGTDLQGNRCHRSTEAWPLKVEGSLSTKFDLTSFVACSGATTEAIFAPNRNNDGEPAQLDSITRDTKLVLLSIGGNDVGFSTFAKACAMPMSTTYLPCTETSASYKTVMGNIDNALPVAMLAAMTHIKNKLVSVGSSAKVLVVGYPYIVTDKYVDTNLCIWLQQSEVSAIHKVSIALNAGIKKSVTDFGGPFAFVSATDSNSPFAGHELCRSITDTGPDYFFGVQWITPLQPEVYTLHPNDGGTTAYATLVKNYLALHPLS